MKKNEYLDAFEKSRHSPGVRQMRALLGPEKGVQDFNVPINISFPGPEFLHELELELYDRLKYYPSEPDIIRQKFSKFLDIPATNLIPGNGSTELFYYLLNASGRKRRLMTDVPTFGRWTDAPRATGHVVIPYHRKVEKEFGIDIPDIVQLARAERVDTVIISNPNNPTGKLLFRNELLRLIGELKANVPELEQIIVDESFLDFSANKKDASLINYIESLEGVWVLDSLGKSFGLHGTRMGVLIGNPRSIEEIQAYIPFWNINGVAESVIDLMPRYKTQFETSLRATIEATRDMKNALEEVSFLQIFSTDGNFVYVKVSDSTNPIALRDYLLLEKGLYVRSCGNKEGATASHFRIATRPLPDVQNLISAIQSFKDAESSGTQAANLDEEHGADRSRAKNRVSSVK